MLVYFYVDKGQTNQKTMILINSSGIDFNHNQGLDFIDFYLMDVLENKQSFPYI